MALRKKRLKMGMISTGGSEGGLKEGSISENKSLCFCIRVDVDLEINFIAIVINFTYPSLNRFQVRLTTPNPKEVNG